MREPVRNADSYDDWNELRSQGVDYSKKPPVWNADSYDDWSVINNVIGNYDSFVHD